MLEVININNDEEMKSLFSNDLFTVSSLVLKISSISITTALQMC